MSTTLSHLSDSQLIQKLEQLVRQETATTCEIILHIIEVSSRKLHIELGHSSLFDYVQKRLSYAESAAYRRIAAAKFLSLYPEGLEFLRRAELNLTTMAEIAKVATKENVTELLNKASGKSKREVEKLLCQYQPARTAPIRESITRLNVKVEKPTSSAPRLRQLPLESNPEENSNYFRGERTAETPQVTNPIEEKIKITFGADPSFEAKIEEARQLLSGKYPQGVSFETLFTTALDCFIEKKSPRKRAERRIAREQKRKQKDTELTKTNGAEKHKTAREIVPLKVRDDVFERDNYCCTFVSSDGQVCGSTWDVELDHIIPISAGGGNNFENLRSRCRIHNIFEAEQIFGVKFMKQFLAQGERL